MTVPRFDRRRVLVTGAAQGIGRRIAERFSAEGAEVIGLDLQPAKGDPPFRLLPLDLADPAAIATTCEALRREWDRLDVLVNAAGILRIGDSQSLTPADWAACMDVNATGPFHLLRQWTGLFMQQRHGAVVNIASNAANLPRAGMLAYCASKAAMVALSHCVGLELAPYGVRCNVVSPGSTDTPMLAGMLADESRKQALITGIPDQFKLGIPLGKIATPDDIADTVLFLASDQAGHITMQQIIVDGGATPGT
ncbi:2,3-dihydro-2,3-dihydroxybenzoate dehydrogenase [Rhizobium halophytocola]|uniref:2,3-dihydro-2,3-dihydroxybenzoate dehydrogenase n=1 Tax=Rhizobium halophytocola TaxID=735519 RepID=A0ABS4DV40_9HYPH|nr:2,3-dihydro-2,3-dihydroxybenzoate dehydrogenase [Rhizobium halophytocola]MBP1849557.1 2,3-dihydro-2,3-dihydroxybenzoate dehydrogenase [Rhizobium halophytocola]